MDYGRNLDLNLLRVFVVVAEAKSVTAAASKLYLTQPAVSAALRRLTEAVGAPLFARQGRGLVLTTRGSQLLAHARPHLAALVDAALTPPSFEPAASDRTMRLGLSDVAEAWLVPALLALLAREAPNMRVVVLPVQFRTVGEVLASGAVDAAVTVADELPSSVRRRPLFAGGFECLYDPRHAKLGARVSERAYFAHEHVIVSYNGDLRGIVEDLLHKTRRVRCSVPTFANIGAIVKGSSMLATVPSIVADLALASHPSLRAAALPFDLSGTSVDLLWPSAADDDPAGQFFRDAVERAVRTRRSSGPRRGSRPGLSA